MILPAGPFDLLYVDFPLYFRTWSEKGAGKSPQRRYRCPPMSELIDLAHQFDAIAAPNAMLASWIYGPRMLDNLTLIEECGFSYTASGFVWVKVDSRGLPLMGCGKTTRKESECLWLCKRGKGLPRRDASVREVIMAPRLSHSTKPEEAAHRLERLYGDVRRIELFARTVRPGWRSWGDQVETVECLTPGKPTRTQGRLQLADAMVVECGLIVQPKGGAS